MIGFVDGIMTIHTPNFNTVNYIYTLVVDDTIIASKLLSITK